MAFAVLLALVSYDPMDPSVNSLREGTTNNWLGSVGANVSDVLMQTLALAAYLLPLPVLVWGYKLSRLRWLPYFWVNLACIPISLILIAIALSALPLDPSFYNQEGYGGALGQVLYGYINGLFAAIVVPYGVYTGLFLFLGLPAYAVSFALNREEWAAISAALTAATLFVLDSIKRFFLALWTGLVATLRFLVGIVSGRKRHTAVYDDYDDEEDYEDDAPVRREPVFGAAPEKVAEVKEKRVRAKVKPSRGKREAVEAQTTLDLGEINGFRLPPLDLLTPPIPPEKLDRLSEELLEQNARMLEGVLDDFGVKGDIRDVRPGPVVTLYELEPSRGTKSSRVIGLADDIARSMSAISARVAVVPGRNAIGIELPNEKRETVFLRELLASREYEQSKAQLPLALGKDIGGAPVIADLAGMPHLLVAGTTGSGKSVGINTMIESLVYRHSPETLRFIMIDPKMLELSVYNDIPHLLTPVVIDAKKAVVALKWAVREMEDRYRNMTDLGVRNLAAFNKRVREARANNELITREIQTGFDRETGDPIMEEKVFDFQPLPYIVVIIDEMADLMLVAGKDVEATVQRLAQMARAAGIHLIMATQRPSVDVITGTIKANFPTRIAFQVTSKIDSRTILGEQGAEQLLGKGDMLFMSGGGRTVRVHGAFVSDEEVEEITTHLRKQAEPDYVSSVTEEPPEGFDSDFIPGPSGVDEGASLYDKAVDIVIRDRRASTSYIQRRLKIGYNKAATLIEEMEDQGVISAPNHKGQREILAPDPNEQF
ncbi:hypothetical protein GCM10017044_06920 [Kordiimonas sediminis]|uniref:DNA translocase FtsK n=2 Tax=Kordiimonas sediminis TaxID=1735581 RepID=A0A919AM80_9PROT|nr:hypothetical protein GCM10017044_06920 [Kordiimonas sediminis]